MHRSPRLARAPLHTARTARASHTARAALAALPALLAACQSAGAPAASELPCDVASVLRERCQSCHAATPVAGAPMALMSYADTQRPAVSAPAVPVWQQMRTRVHSATSPMPPNATLSAAELAALDGWFGASAPARTGAACEVPDGGAPDAASVGPAALPCPADQQVSFRAHGAEAGSAFHVPADAGNLQECFAFRSPFTSPTHATAFAPIIDDARVVHHWILFETSVAQTEGALGPCQMPADATFVAGWAPGAGNRSLPDDVGQQMPTQGAGWFILQVHYWNAAQLADANDRSGVALCATTQLRAHTAAVHTLGTLNIAIAPHALDYSTTGSCTPAATEPVHILGAGPHMHRLGTAIRTDVLRGGDPARAETLVEVPRWDFNTQDQYPSALTVMPGDTLRTTCRYANTTDALVTFGERTEDEMCFDFVLAWPAGALANTAGARTNRCIDRAR